MSVERVPEGHDWVFAEDVQSHVGRRECERLAMLAKGLLVLELGSCYGRSTIALASTASRVHAVDWHRGDPNVEEQYADWPGTSLGTYFANLKRYGVDDRVITHVGRFEHVCPVLKSGFDVAFVDGYHSRAATRESVALARDLSQQCVAVHDWGFFEVSPGCLDVFNRLPDRIVDSVALWFLD